MYDKSTAMRTNNAHKQNTLSRSKVFRLENNLKETHPHTHTHLTAPFPGLPGWASTRKVKPIWILLKQETVSGSGISWDICKSTPRSRQITMPAPHHSSFLQAGCPSCRPTNSVKGLKMLWNSWHTIIAITCICPGNSSTQWFQHSNLSWANSHSTLATAPPYSNKHCYNYYYTRLTASLPEQPE